MAKPTTIEGLGQRNMTAATVAQALGLTLEQLSKLTEKELKPRTPLTAAFQDEIKQKYLESQGEAGNNGTAPESPATSVPQDAPEDDPAIQAFLEWENNLEIVHKSPKVLSTWPSRERDDVMFVKYETVDGGKRVSDSRTQERRRRSRDYIFELPVFSKETEEAGAVLLLDLPGAPTLESTCRLCGQPLFRDKKQLLAEAARMLEYVEATSDANLRSLPWRLQDGVCVIVDRTIKDLGLRLGSLSTALASTSEERAEIQNQRRDLKQRATRTLNRLIEAEKRRGNQFRADYIQIRMERAHLNPTKKEEG